jgi:hypothetical protein
MLPGAEAVAAAHAQELPQKDELCGAFWGAIALQAAGIVRFGDEPVDQDAVAQRAGTLLSEHPQLSLPAGESGRRDFRLAHPVTADAGASGTSAVGVADALAELSGGELSVLPCSGAWTEQVVVGVMEALIEIGAPVTVIANVYTGDLWDFRTGLGPLLAYLATGAAEDRPCDWKVGHFVGLAGLVEGDRGTLVAVADTYPSLGWNAWHLQPAERVAAALTRSDGSEGGLLLVVPSSHAAAVAERMRALGLARAHWSNGSEPLAA